MHLRFLALFGIICSSYALKPKTSFVKNLADHLQVYYEVSKNPSAALEAQCKAHEAPLGLCSQVNLHLVYNGNQPVYRKDWKIYFHNIRLVLAAYSKQFAIRHVNGDLHEVSPTSNFTGLVKGQKVVITMLAEYWVLSYSDFMPNAFVAIGCDASVINNTADVSSASKFCHVISPQKLKRMDTDKSMIVDHSVRYKMNKRNGVQLLPSEELEGHILPTPVHTTRGEHYANISGGIRLSGPVWELFSKTTKDALRIKLQSLGVGVALPERENETTFYNVILQHPTSNHLQNKTDAYQMKVMQSYTIIKGRSRGAFYGIHSFISLITVGKPLIRTVNITDYARFHHRGMMVDVARNFKSKTVILKLLDSMASYKLNTLHLHLSDDEGWRVEIPGLKELTEFASKRCIDATKCLLPQLGSGPSYNNQGSGFFSVADYEEIVKYAHSRFIKVIPEIDMPAHARAAVIAMEMRYLRYKELDMQMAQKYRLLDPYDETNMRSIQYYDRTTALNPCMTSTYAFVSKVISEVQKMHERAGQPLNEWHYGGDEVNNIYLKDWYKDYNFSQPQHKPWEKSKACRNINATIDTLSSAFMKNVQTILKSKGIAVMHAWSDAATEDNDSTQTSDVKLTLWNILEWGATERFRKLAESGYRLVNSMPDFMYFDMPYEANPYERGYYWATRFTDLKKVYTFAPVCLPQNVETSVTRLGHKYPNMTITRWPNIHGQMFHWDGIQGNLWTETVRSDEQLEYMIYPRIIALAERAWHKASWEKSEEECKGTTFGFGKDGTPLNTNLHNIQTHFNKFVNIIGQRELSKLERLGVKYRIPLPGYVLKNGTLYANIEIPGLTVQYSTNNGKTWMLFNASSKPRVTRTVSLQLRTISKNGRRSREQPPKCILPKEPETPEEICKEKITGIFPLPNDKRRFVLCDHGRANVKNCPPTLVFNPLINVCDFAKEKSIQAFCTSREDGLYPSSRSCTEFIHCANKITYIKSCPPTLRYNSGGKFCDFPQNVNCSITV